MPITPAPPKLKVNKPSQGAISAHQDNIPIPQEPTQPAPAKTRTKDKVITRGVGIKQSLLAELEKIAKEQDIAVNSLSRFALEYFVTEYKQGTARQKLEARKKTKSTIS